LGLSLRPCLQQAISPFRDTYQSTTYFSTALAVHRFLSETHFASEDDAGINCYSASGGAKTAEPGGGLQWTGYPRLFEIGRTRAFDLSGEPDFAKDPQSKDCDLNGKCLSIAAPQPVGILSNPS